MIEVGENAKIKVHWKVNPYDYSPEKKRTIMNKMGKKYGIPANKVKVETEFIMLDKSGKELSFTNDVITNIQNPEFQLKLFQEYINLNGVEGYDFDMIKAIDAEINSKIDYDVYDKFRKYSIKWIKWDNFLSYGENNEFDFTTLKGIIHLNGEPANQSGKTTFAIDLVHFLLFGKTSKAATLDKVFNRHIPSATTVNVEGCIEIDGVEYVIKRTLTRPQLSKRTSKSKTTQKVEYYKVVGQDLETLEDYVENQQGENTIQTNKAIKEAIGKESDFDLIMSITEDNLDDLIKQKETERGKLLSRWIGLLPIEQKDVIAREKYNSEIKPYLLSNRYNEEALKQEIDAFTLEIEKFTKYSQELESKNKELANEIDEYEKMRDGFITAKQQVDSSIMSIDITTLNANLENCVVTGKQKKIELDAVETEIKSIGEVQFSFNEYNQLLEKKSSLETQKGVKQNDYKHISKNIDQLTKSEFCPTCGRKLDNVDNSAKINELTKELNQIVVEGKQIASTIKQIEDTINALSDAHDKYDRLSKLKVTKSALEYNISELRNQYVELFGKKKDYEKNSKAIEVNNNLDINIRNTEAKIKAFRETKDENIRSITTYNQTIEQYSKSITDRKDMIQKLAEEAKLIFNWKLYLEMIGKNGISKMVLRNTLPIINANLERMLSDVCDFDVKIDVTPKNDVVFYLVRDGVMADLSSGSGFEKTASALALRAVLANISTLPRMSCLLVDEVMGRVAKENYDNMHRLFEKILCDYDYIFFICHLDEVKEWSTQQVVISKENDISHITVKSSE